MKSKAFIDGEHRNGGNAQQAPHAQYLVANIAPETKLQQPGIKQQQEGIQ